MVYLSWILVWFEAISGLKINPEKSYVLVVGSMEDLEGLVLELGCRHLWVCVAIQTLLGMGLKRGSRKTSHLEEIVYFKRGKAYSHKKHSLQLAYLHYVPFLATKGCKHSIGED